MSAVTHPQSTIKQQLLRDQRRAKIVALVAVAILAAVLVALMLALDGGDAPTTAQQKPAAEVRSQAQTSSPAGRSEPAAPQVGSYPSGASVPPSLLPDTRYDGGPDEGTRGPGH